MTVKTSWPGADEPYPKTLSAVLYDHDKSPVARGNEALKTMLATNDATHTLIRRVKLLLAEDRKHHDPNMERLGLQAVDVIGDFLSFLVHDIEQHLAQAGWGSVDRSKLTWCMTVPARWSEAAKQTMRKASFMAEMIPSIDSPQLKFCVEPEAALFNVALTSGYLKPGSRALVLDMGGGTVDLAAFEIEACETSWHKLQLSEITSTDGHTTGSTYFDEAFVQFVRKLVGEDAYDKTVAKYPVVADHLHQQWVKVKHAFSGDADDTIIIPLDARLMTAIPKTTLMELVRSKALDHKTRELRFTGQTVIDCFNTVFPAISKIARDMINKSTVFRRGVHGRIPGHEKYVTGTGAGQRIRVFFPIIKIGDELPLNAPLRKFLHPSGPSQTMVEFTLYASRAPEVPRFVDETCKVMAKVQYKCNMTPRLYEMGTMLPIDFSFSDSSIMLRAFDPTNKNAEYRQICPFNPFAQPGLDGF
ncbi:hypothetical protein H9P43_008975 [Blastocladiella emersonii ATCC 22665]|nr:hypothetical protein H9P43_008975 [Blastocladiella emersonii ATCC 22665]